MAAIKIGITGGAGRMGKILIAEVMRTNDCELVGATVIDNDANRGKDAGEVAGLGRIGVLLRANKVDMFESADVVIDFTSPAASLEHCLLAHQYGTALVIGTTGFSDSQLRMLGEHAKAVPILASPNMSLGVNIAQALTEQVARLLDDSFDIEIVEMHHRYKMDSPSGTALALGQAAARGRNVDLEDKAVYERYGQTGVRKQGSIGFATLRGGDVIGDHTVVFAADGERVEISHKASSRQIYARGALKAARWLVKQQPALYNMRDVLGIKI